MKMVEKIKNTKFRILLTSFVFILMMNVSLASRTMKLFPIDTPTGWSEHSTDGSPRGSCAMGFTRTFAFINLSNLTQTLTIKTKDVYLDFGQCNSPSIDGNWERTPTPGCGTWKQPPRDLTDIVVVLGPNQSKSKTLTYMCTTKRSGVSNCTENYAWPADTADLISSVIGSATSTHEFIIAEDRGAIMASITASGQNACSELKNNTRFNIPINGGRAF